MIDNPVISIIVPVYKAENYIRKCLDSILSQTFQNFEVILIDDGSPDMSGQICELYAETDSRIHVFHKANGGVSSARQYGLEKSKGIYTIHVDPDDWIDQHMLEDMYKKAEAEEADIVLTDFYLDTEVKTEYVKINVDCIDHLSVLKGIIVSQQGACWNKLIKRSIYKQFNVQFPQDLSIGEDLYVVASILMHNVKIAYIENAYYHYVKYANVNSLTNKTSYQQLKLLLIKLKEVLSKDLYETYALPVLTSLLAVNAFYNKNITSKVYRKEIWPQKSIWLNSSLLSPKKKVLIFLSCFGLKKIMLSFTIYFKI